MKTFEIWADIVQCEDGVQIDDVGDSALMGSFATQDEAEAARIRMVDVHGLRELCEEILAEGISPNVRQGLEDILRD